MTDITLEAIKAEQSRLAGMIAELEQQSKSRPCFITFPKVEIELNRGERYAGIVLGGVALDSYHLILLPDEAESIDWPDAKGWAAGIGGALPIRREQALLFANLKGEFKESWYWSAEQHASYSDCAWIQYFESGRQDLSSKRYDGHARAVRRLPI